MWQLLLEENGPEILYIPELNRHADDEKMSKEKKWNNFLTLLNHFKTDSDDQNNNYRHNYSQLFANNQNDDEIYSLTVGGIAVAQRSDSKWEKFFNSLTGK